MALTATNSWTTKRSSRATSASLYECFLNRWNFRNAFPTSGSFSEPAVAPATNRGRITWRTLPSGPEIEVLIACSQDHNRHVGAGTFTTRLGKGTVLFHRVPDMHPVMQQCFLANALLWLTS
jgi:hypothetical protein